jgi:23S rRNA pseudouridine1911/1915/1917 synthase
LKISEENIIYEDNHLIAVNKQCGQLVQGDITGDVCLADALKDFLKKKYNKQGNVFVGVTHRLDRPVSGVVLFAKTGKALSRLNNMFREKEIGKYYLAIVKEAPQETKATLKNYLIRNHNKNMSFVSKKQNKDAKEAILDYEFIAQSDNYSLLKIKLHTGRHHQIRVQLSNIGSPIKGDLKYSYPRSNPDGGISLHAYKLEFLHPVKKEHICIKANLPKENLWQAFSNIIEDI